MTNRGGLRSTAALLEADVEPGLWLKGAQICVVRGGETHHLSVGDAGTGVAVSTDTVFKVYCAIKPITAIAIAKLVDRGRLDLDRPLRDYLTGYRALDEHDITLHHVLSHTAGLHTTSTVELELLPPTKRETLLRRAEPPAGWVLGQDAGYSEFVGWHLLGRVIEAVTGRPVRDHLRESVIDPFEMRSTWLGMSADEYAAVYERLGVSWHLRSERATPMLRELSEVWCREVNCASGGYSSAGDLARFYAKLSAQLNGAELDAAPSRATLATFCSSARPRAYDVVLECECSHGLGFMTDLAGRFGGDVPSPSSFGYSGLAGSTFAFGDPTHDLGVAVIVNGIIDPAASVLRRDAIVHAIYQDLAIGCERITDGLSARR